MSDEMMQHYEVLRSQMLADKGDSMLSPRNLSVGILISQGLIGWSKLWGRGDQEMKTGRLVSEPAVDSGAEARGSFAMESELRNILVNITLQHLHNIPTQAKGEKL